MSTLTSIPRELRDHILGYVIQTNTNDAPDINQTFEDLVQDRKVFTNPSLNSWCTTVLYQPETTIANTTSILFTNRQLRNDTLENIKRLNANGCELDVIILDEILPLVTRTHVPIFATSYDKVNVTYRISGVYDDQKEVGWIEEGTRVDGPYTKYGLYKRFRGGNGAGPAIGWQLYSILERFIKAGPTGEGSDRHAHSHITVKTIASMCSHHRVLTLPCSDMLEAVATVTWTTVCWIQSISQHLLLKISVACCVVKTMSGFAMAVYCSSMLITW
jgi:hypothetical protein